MEAVNEFSVSMPGTHPQRASPTQPRNIAFVQNGEKQCRRASHAIMEEHYRMIEGRTMEQTVYTHDELREMVAPLLVKYDMASASLFGSYARGDATVLSDIDLLLIGNEGFRPINVFGVAEELHRISGKAVDVYEISELNHSSFRETVLREAVAL